MKSVRHIYMLINQQDMDKAIHHLESAKKLIEKSREVKDEMLLSASYAEINHAISELLTEREVG